LVSKRTTGSVTYINQTAGDIFLDLIANRLNADFVYGVADDPGPSIPKISFFYEPLSAAFDRLAKASNTDTDTYFVRSTSRRVFHFQKQTTTTAPWGVSDEDGSDGDILIQVSAERTREKYANRVYVLSSQTIGDAVTEEYPGDGSTRDFNTAGPIFAEPTVLIRTGSPPTANSQTVGIAGMDAGKDWYWSEGSTTLTQDAGGTTLADGDSISISYQQNSDSVALYQYDAAVDERAAVEGGTGYYETVVTLSIPTTQEAMDALAEAYAKKLGKIITAIEISTFRPGLRAGQLIAVHLSDIGADDDFLIDSISLSTENNRLLWKAHAIASPIIGDYRKALADLARDDVGGGGGGGAGEEILERTLLIKDATIGDDIADHVPIQASGTGMDIVGVLRVPITEDLSVRVIKAATVLCTITIPDSTAVDNPVIVTSGVAGTAFTLNEILTWDITESDEQKVRNGIASFTLRWRKT
jgi:hypothetical protein